MSLREYQQSAVDGTFAAWREYRRVLGVMATGGGKTVLAGEIFSRIKPDYGCLFLADAEKLVTQAAGSIAKWTGEPVQVEMAEQGGGVVGDRIRVGTIQSICRRLDRMPSRVGCIIIDEAHRATLGQQTQVILDHYRSAYVLGLTATPYRSDKKELGSVYQAKAFDVGLWDLIERGFLSPIKVLSVPTNIDMNRLRAESAEVNNGDAAAAIEPWLDSLVEIWVKHAKGRKTVCFLPLVSTSKLMRDAFIRAGIDAMHVDGTDSSALNRDDWQVVCNASLLTTGWDHPPISCVYPIRPTKSESLFSQMVGRGTRIFPGKSDCLILDPLFVSSQVRLVRPWSLIAKTPQLAVQMEAVMAAKLEQGLIEGVDLREIEESAEEKRLASLQWQLKKASKKSARLVDAMDFAYSLNVSQIIEYEPEFEWERAAASRAQIAALERAGFDPEGILSKGHASRILDTLTIRREKGLATPKQLKYLKQFRVPNLTKITFEEATRILDEKFTVRNNNKNK
jgi:superfamily II DNA or RNA helicase